MGEEIIRLDNISKTYAKKLILEDVNLVIERGTSIALLGNNGTGKSTLLKIVSKLTNVDSGKVIHHGHLKFNYIPEHFPKLNLSMNQYLEYMGSIDHITHNEYKAKYEELIHNFHMDSMVDIQMKHLSKGSLQKVGVIQALLKKPDVLLLDEPLSGQDVESQNYFIQLVNDLKSQGVAIVMSCHEMFLVNQVSDLAYRIKNRHLVPVDINHIPNVDYDILCFDNGNNRMVPVRLQSDIVKIESYDLMLRLIVTKEKSNPVLREMLSEGFQLRSMRGINE